MTDDRKVAEAAVKAAEKAWNSASTKAGKARETYQAAQSEANAAARALTYAKANPVLFDDDPLTEVRPTVADLGAIHTARVSTATTSTSGGAKVDTVYVQQAAPAHTLPAPTPEPEVLEQRQAAVAEQAAQQGDEPPWNQPVPEAAPAKAPRKPRIPRKSAAEKAAEAEPVQDDGQAALAASEGLVNVTDLPEVPFEDDADGYAAPVAVEASLRPF